ncbi:MAG: hypothetical protein KC503_45175 [Myxococcales bacterium]|nr:hypothetical protein [Myxococcales bacterium]
MASEREVTFSDIKRAVRDADPQLADLVVRFLEQPDPAPGQPEEPPEDPADAPPAPGRDDWTLQRLKSTINPGALAAKTATERKVARRESWQSLLATDHPPPRLLLGDVLIELYDSGAEQGRAALMAIVRRGRVGWGLWKALKQIYKRAEERHDAAMFGVLAYRLDELQMGGGPARIRDEVQMGTLIYMQRRAWRYLRHLGQALPELYPQFAVEVLRHYPPSFNFTGSWLSAHIWAHENLRGETTAYVDGPPKELKKRAFDEAWKTSADPLLRLLEDARNDKVCDFAIRSLEKDFPSALEKVDVEWIARVARRAFGSVHEFVVKLCESRPELHPSKLAAQGLGEMALDFLLSPSAKARKFAIDYAKAHGGEIDIERLVKLADEGAKEVRELAVAQLERRAAGDIGIKMLARLLGVSAASEMARKKLAAALTPADVDEQLYVDLALGEREQRDFIAKLYSEKKAKVPAKYLCKLLEDDRCDYQARKLAVGALKKRDGAEIGQAWFKRAVLDSRVARDAWSWLKAGKLKGADLDVEWLKGLTMRPQLRGDALAVLGDRKLVEPKTIGLPWLLAMARQADESLSTFAHRYLLENFSPSDFHDSGDAEAGIERLWGLAGGRDEPEAVRTFASAYLRYHHPELGPTLREARSLGIKPALARSAYTLARVEPLLGDKRADVRRLGAAIAAEELVRWGDKRLPYRLADSVYRETRGVAFGVLLKLGDEDADPKKVPPADWLDADALFGMAESSTKATREVALTLIRRHYADVGGAARLAWLMESPDREVRLFAVRLLWDKHRPLGGADEWSPKKGEGFAGHSGATLTGDERSVEALRGFLRSVMFGLPPGRMERREVAGDALPDRPLPSSVAKRRLLEVVRAMSIEERDFAVLALPVLEEFMTSQAKGEWQSCVAALASIRAAHPGIETTLPAGFVREGTPRARDGELANR